MASTSYPNAASTSTVSTIGKSYQYLISKERKEGSGKALFDEEERGALGRKVVIAWEKNEAARTYAVARNYMDLLNHILSVDIPCRRFHEVCVRGSPQKPRFDIDLSLKDVGKTFDEYVASRNVAIPNLEEMGQIIINLLLDNIVGIFLRDGVPFDLRKNVIFCISHKPGVKQSFHLILDGLGHFGGSREAQAFYEEVIKFNSDPVVVALLKKYCDGSIYAGDHLFRMLGNHKWLENDRPKVFRGSFMYRDEKIEHDLGFVPVNERQRQQELFGKSLITFMTNTRYLPNYYVEKPKGRVMEGISDEVCDQAMKLLDAYCAEHGIEEGTFELDDVENGFIKLLRMKPSYCEVCAREHDKIGPFLFIDRDIMVKMNCRRFKGRHVDLGTLDGIVGDALAAAMRWNENFKAAGVAPREERLDGVDFDDKSTLKDGPPPVVTRSAPFTKHTVIPATPIEKLRTKPYDEYIAIEDVPGFIDLDDGYVGLISEPLPQYNPRTGPYWVDFVIWYNDQKIKGDERGNPSNVWKRTVQEYLAKVMRVFEVGAGVEGIFKISPLKPFDVNMVNKQFDKHGAMMTFTKIDGRDGKKSEAIVKYSLNNFALLPVCKAYLSRETDFRPYHQWDIGKLDPWKFNMFPGFVGTMREPFTMDQLPIIQPILDHIVNILARGDRAIARNIMSHMIYGIRMLVRSGKILFLYSPNQGSGKTTIYEFIIQFVYGHYLCAKYDRLEALATNFSGEMAGKTVLHIEETSDVHGCAASKTAAEKLMGYSDGARIYINPKGKQAYDQENFLVNLVTSNHLTYKIPPSDRRNSCHSVSEEKRGMIKDYFTPLRAACFNQKCGDVFFAFCLSDAIVEMGLWEDVALIDPPMTDCKRALIERTGSAGQDFVNSVATGEIELPLSIIGVVHENIWVDKQGLFSVYSTHCRAGNYALCLNRTTLTNKFCEAFNITDPKDKAQRHRLDVVQTYGLVVKTKLDVAKIVDTQSGEIRTFQEYLDTFTVKKVTTAPVVPQRMF